MRTFSKDIDAGTEHKVIFFISPSDVKNIAFLTYDYSDKDSAFMGSDFSYSDMTDKELYDYTFKLLKETTIKRKRGNEAVWVIESLLNNQAVIDKTCYMAPI